MQQDQRLASAKPAVPNRFEKYLAEVVKPTAAERARLLDGGPIARPLSVAAENEVAVFGAVWIDAPISRYTDAMRDIEKFERGAGFRITKRISAVPTPQDFELLQLPKSDVDDLRRCRVGDCSVKLDEHTIRQLRRDVDWKAPDVQARVDAVMQRFALGYATGYLEGGNQRLAVYRDTARSIVVAEEFRALAHQLPELTSSMPSVRRYLLEFPSPALDGVVSFLYWQELKFGLKPTIRISHLIILEGRDEAVVASKMLYATHYFWTGLELRVLLADPSRGPGFWFVVVNRGRSDGLRGVTGFFVRMRVRTEVQARTLSALRGTKSALEQGGWTADRD
jgi:hypothetical protein